MMNNKGFAATGILYTIFVLFILLMIGILSMLYSRNNLLSTMKSRIRSEIESGSVCSSMVGTTWHFDYIGSEQEFVTPCSGMYKIELWGAQGGDVTVRQTGNESAGGLGAYTAGNLQLENNEKLYIYVGKAGYEFYRTEGEQLIFNGGGVCNQPEDTTLSASGGGATDVRLLPGLWNSFDGLKSRIMVASGGGALGYTNHTTAGAGGGLIGYDAVPGTTNDWISKADYGLGGTQTSGGKWGNSSSNTSLYAGSFGNGGNSIGQHDGGGSGGSGYYGGGGGRVQSGAGGSSFISGHSGCDSIAELSTESNIIHSGKSIHYSGYKFLNTVMIDGNGYNWTDKKENYIGMPTHDGANTMDGNVGNGFAKITLLSING